MATKQTTSPKRSSSRSSKRRRATAPARCPSWRGYLTTRRPQGKTRGWLAIRWIEKHCVHTNDRWLGKPFRLLPWQKWVILALFTVGADGLRVIRWALIGIAKKNGKTELAAALALFFAFGPSGPNGDVEPAALVIVAAGSDEQADMVFGAAKTMAEQSPTLSQILEAYEDEILCPELPGSKVKRVAAAAKRLSSTLDGKNIYVVICDELHCWEGNQARVVWDTLTNGTVTRLQPLVLQITTAGVDPGLELGEPETLCGEQYAYGKAVATGEVVDPAYLFWWVEPPLGADHTDPDVIKAANPSFGRIMQLAFYLDQLTKKTPAVFRRYFLNQWTQAKETWLPEGAWDAGDIGDFNLEPHTSTWVGTDASTKHDSTAHVRAQWHGCSPECPGWDPELDSEGVLKLRVKSHIWERPFDPRTRRPLQGWKLPIAEVENELRDYHRDLELVSCGYDPALFERSAQQLEAEGLPMEEVPQSDQRMVPAAQTLFQLVVEHRLEHDGDLAFARHIRNAVAVQARGGDGGWRLKKGAGRMDAAIATAIAAWLATFPVEQDEPPASAESTPTPENVFRPKERLRL